MKFTKHDILENENALFVVYGLFIIGAIIAMNYFEMI